MCVCVHMCIYKYVFSRSLTQSFTKDSREFVSAQTFRKENHRTVQQCILDCFAAEISRVIQQKLRDQKEVGKYSHPPLSKHKHASHSKQVFQYETRHLRTQSGLLGYHAALSPTQKGGSHLSEPSCTGIFS